MAINGKLLVALLLVLVCALWVSTTAAFGHIQYQGYDYSYEWDNVQRMAVCDNERDGHGVYTNYDRYYSSGHRIFDGNGASQPCGTSGEASFITGHQTCESVPYAPDYCTSYYD